MVLRQLDIHRFKNEFWPYTKVNSKWVKELGIRPETLQLIEEYVGLTFQHDGTGTNFLSKKPKAQERKPRFKSGIAANSKASAQQRKQIRAGRENLHNGRSSPPAFRALI